MQVIFTGYIAQPEINMFLITHKLKKTTEKKGKNFIFKYNLFLIQIITGNSKINIKKSLFKNMNNDTRVKILKFLSIFNENSFLNIKETK